MCLAYCRIAVNTDTNEMIDSHTYHYSNYCKRFIFDISNVLLLLLLSLLLPLSLS